jgi:hypothetical protein
VVADNEDLSGKLDAVATKKADELLGKAADFARTQPVAFFAGAVATSFALSRFLRVPRTEGRSHAYPVHPRNFHRSAGPIHDAAAQGEGNSPEMSEKISQVAIGLAMIVVGSVLLIPALVIMLQAGVSALITTHVTLGVLNRGRRGVGDRHHLGIDWHEPVACFQAGRLARCSTKERTGHFLIHLFVLSLPNLRLPQSRARSPWSKKMLLGRFF